MIYDPCGAIIAVFDSPILGVTLPS